MKVRHLTIKNFRGIKELDWNITCDFVTLIGPGDSTKSTILDAIEYVLSPRWNLNFVDTDFFNGNSEDEIEITASISGIPRKLLDLEKFGSLQRGWSSEDGIVDDPLESYEPVLTIQLTVDESLEPKWQVIKDARPDGKSISAKDRETLGVARLGPYVDRDLSWSKGSALSRFSEIDEGVSNVLLDANRKARQSVLEADLEGLRGIAGEVKIFSQDFGVKLDQELVPALDPKSVFGHQGSLAIHHGEIPLRMLGLGSRRLATLAIHRNSVPEGAILLIDEIESNLEPHRLRHLIRKLRPTESDPYQIFTTTHSSVSIVELKAKELHIVKSQDGVTTVTPVPETLQGVIRISPEAFLAKFVIVCEGQTEIGFCRSLDEFWSGEKETQLLSFGCLGVVPVNGGGNDFSQRASGIYSLGYEVLAICDSDDAEYSPTKTELEEQGVTVIEWSGGVSIEERIVMDLPIEGVQDFIDKAKEIRNDDQAIHQEISSRCNIAGAEFEGNVQEFVDDVGSENARAAIGLAAKKKGWFKRIDWGELMGKVVIQHLSNSNKDSNLTTNINALKGWIYDR
jgi:hypothetical protein